MRIDKFLSECKISSRSETAKAVRRGDVLLDGVPVKRTDTPVDPEKSVVTYCGEVVHYRRNTYVLLNKPSGYVSATEDKKDKTVLDLLPEQVTKFGVFPCGRLDKNTLGLMLLTDNGPLAHALLSPRRHVEKVYRFECAHKPSESDLEALQSGVDIGGYVTKPCVVKMTGDTSGEITLSEGKYHQIKLMFEAVDNRILYLERIRFAFLTLDGMERGEWRYLTDDEIKKLEGLGI